MKKKQRLGHDSLAIANMFVRTARTTPGSCGSFTLMALLKYVYIAHGFTLAYTKKPLICHSVEAWKYGPVVPEIYHAFAKQGMYVNQEEIISINPFKSDEPNLSDIERKIIKAVYDEYSMKTPVSVSYFTHLEDSPWHQFKQTAFAKIPDQCIYEYFSRSVRGLDLVITPSQREKHAFLNPLVKCFC